MSYPKRIRQERAGSFEALLVDAMRSERPSAKSRQRGLLAIAGASASTAIGWTARAAAIRVLTHWSVVGGGGGLLALGVAHEIHRVVTAPASVTAVSPARRSTLRPGGAPASPPSMVEPVLPPESMDVAPPAPALVALPSPPERVTAVLPTPTKAAHSIVAPAVTAPTSTVPSAVALAPEGEHPAVTPAPPINAASPTPPDELSEETASLYAVKEALDAHQAARALQMLGAHTRRFPRGKLKLEADLLRLESLSSTGDTVQAQALARALIAEDPSGPHAQRIRSLLEKPNHRDR